MSNFLFPAILTRPFGNIFFFFFLFFGGTSLSKLYSFLCWVVSWGSSLQSGSSRGGEKRPHQLYLTWALTYRANHSRPFPFSLLQYSPNLAFSSWSKSSLKGTEQGKELSVLGNKHSQSGEGAGEATRKCGPPSQARTPGLHQHVPPSGDPGGVCEG